MVDNFSDLTYVHLMISTSQEETLAVKAAFEIWAFTFGVKIHIYYSENGIFSEQHFRSAVKDSNPKKCYFLVGILKC